MTIRPAIPSFRGPNYYVPDMFYAADVGMDGICRADLGVPAALDVDGILDNQSIATAGSTQTFMAAYTALMALGNGLARYGRSLIIVASGAATSTVSVEGHDYLGQPMLETFTLNGTTAVGGVKMFWSVSKVSWEATAATTIDLGWSNTRLGIPYRAVTSVIIAGSELVSHAAPTAGALLVGASATTTQTATSSDPRGYYVPNAGNLPDGVRSFALDYHVDVVYGLHGQRHFAG